MIKIFDVFNPNPNQIKERKKNIKNKHYRQFLDNGNIDFINENDIILVLNNIKSKYKLEARSLLICAYYTGARPNEYLRLKAQDITKDGHYIKIQLQPSKKGLPRPVYLKYSNPLIKELYKFTRTCFPAQFIFYHFKDKYIRVNNKGISRIEIGSKLRYHFIKWFEILPRGTIPPYFLRHNRFSKLAAKGITMEQLRQIKGSKTFASVMPYLHLSTENAKAVAKKMD